MNPWVLLGILGACVASFLGGVAVESDRRDALLLAQQQAMHEAYVAQAQRSRSIAQDISRGLTDEQIRRQADAVAYREQVRRARATLAVCPPAVPVQEAPMATVAPDVGEPVALRGPEPRLTAEFVRLYDLAHGAAVPGAGDTREADGAAARAGTVGPEDVLAVHGDNADAWAECRANLRGWQALARKHGWTM
ncbi:MAG: hypothetical protein IT531_00110 [Burkholderiales bacterium]|nr:hypothetical protein [Burkholderiales bacterium]